jgi:very-short-patch-repair endonuclease
LDVARFIRVADFSGRAARRNSQQAARDDTCAEAAVVGLAETAVAGIKLRHESPRSCVERGAERTAVTQGRDLLVIRFTNDHVMNDVDAVCREIIATCLTRGAQARGRK